jgi:predicted anti-sigma-YlaC factor YlaD
MTCERYRAWFGDAVEGTLDAERQAQVEAHCSGCAACRELLDDLRKISAAAAALDRLTPSPDVWQAIAAQVKQPDAATALPLRGWRATAWPRLAAAAALMLLLGAAAWFALGTMQRDRIDGDASALVRNAASELQLAEQHYQNAIAALEQLTVGRDGTLDAAVAAEIAQSLQSIDRAIADSRAALKSDPSSFVAQTSLLEALRMKVGLLQETVSLMNATS